MTIAEASVQFIRQAEGGASAAHFVPRLQSKAELAKLRAAIGSGELQVEIYDDGLFPDIRRDDLLTVEPVDVTRIRRGDVVYFHNRDRVFARRFATMNGTNVVLRDAVGYEDIVPASDVLGRAIDCERGGAKIAVSGIRPRPVGTLWQRLRAWLRYKKA